MATKKKKADQNGLNNKVAYLFGAIVAIGIGLFVGWGLRGAVAQNVCVELKLPVSLAKDKPVDQVVAATYCQPARWADGPHQLDVLTAGAGYNSAYYDWPQESGKYSYVKKTLNAGRATLNYDRIGAGQSSRPASTDITLASDSYVLHQLIQAFKLTGYKHINSVGHSYGTGVVIDEAAVYGDVSRVIATGYLHDPRNAELASRNYPANQDPAFAGKNLDDGYLTSKPGTRGSTFYSSSAESSVTSYDDAHKDVVSRTAFLGYAAQQGVPADNNTSSKITVPVFVIVGQKDLIFCHNPAVLDCTNKAAVQSYEAPFYKRAKSMKVATIADTGHDLTLHPSAQESFDAINTWIKEN